MTTPRERRRRAISVPPSAAPDASAPVQVSAMIAEYIARHRGDRVSIGDLITALGERAYGALLLVFAAPNLPPIGLPVWVGEAVR